MQLTTKTRYSIVFLLHLASNGERFTGVYEVSDKQCISAHYLDQLARKLRKGGLVEAKKGPNGGYKLSRNMEDIDLLDIFQAVGENYSFNLYDIGMRETLETSSYETYISRLTGIVRQELKKINLKNIKEKNYANC